VQRGKVGEILQLLADRVGDADRAVKSVPPCMIR
jgi:hypothetical protein